MANDRLRAAREGTPSRRHPGPIGRDELAALVSEFVTKHDERGRLSAFDANHLGKLERGTVARPSPPIRAALCALLDASEADLGFVPQCGTERVSAALIGTVHTDRAALECVAQVLASLRRLEDATSAGEVLPTVRTQAALVSRLADNARSPLRKQAVGLLSELEQYLGWLSIPLERWEESRKHLDRASVLALEADDPMRLSTALSFAAYRNLRRDHLRSAEALNEAAARDERVHVGLRTYVQFQRAEVLARDGSRTEALDALKVADHLADELPDDEDELPSSAYWYVPSFFHGQRAFVLKALGDEREARRIATEALEIMPPSWRDSEWAGRRRKLAELDA
ncbi:hypothetical protein SAMN05216266_12752 [Amycolatopsis marina]|uniref:Uncharacterized protein n=1 Tax=Amycolatopsis marina TaxID=490629 RepID=A0A1I1CJV2_9PSEU|nr:XRE family transcriptional regulator [Amycolatopsis marina]SFB61178.1 hypothetical protein SAMN05216266_12752 [Amycolatopsis marina]